MEQDIDQPARRALAPDADPSATREAAERPKAFFSVRLTLSGSSQDFEDPRRAGEAFFRADPAERPSVTHIDGNSARIMARTEFHGTHEGGAPRHFKTLPDSHAPDAEFRAGFLAAMEASISEQLEKITVGRGAENVTDRLDSGLKDDLEAFARREPGKAAVLWTERTDEPAPGPVLQAALKARDGVLEAEAQVAQAVTTEKPVVIAAGDWVTTDKDVDLRPVAVATERGLHAGFEARVPEGEVEIRFSDRTFATSRDALRHAWDFYEGGETGLQIAVSRARGMDRDFRDDGDRAPSGLVIEHRDQPEFPRPEAAIHAGDAAQLVLTLGRDTEATRALAEDLVADPAFRKLVAEHIPDAGSTLGTGSFTDGADSRGFLPAEALVVSSYDRNGGSEVRARFPDEGPLSQALARHLAESPVLAAHVEADRLHRDVGAEPARAISDWVAQSEARIDRLPPGRQEDLRSELHGIAKDAAAAFGVDQERADSSAPPRSTLYSTALSGTAMATGAEPVALSPEAGTALRAGLHAAAEEAGIDRARLDRRLATGAANAREEDTWFRSDIADVAARHRLDLADDTARGRAADITDRFYQKAADLVQAARSSDHSRDADSLLAALGSMTKLHAAQGMVAFRNDDQARDFAEAMQERYGASILKDMAAGRTEALTRDVPDPAARQAMAAAVVSAAREHPGLGLSAHDAETADRKLTAEAQRQDRVADHARDRNHDREL